MEESVTTTLPAALGTTTSVDQSGSVVYRVDSGFDLDQYLYREDSPLDFSIDVPDSYGPVTEEGAPAPGNTLYGKTGLLTMRVYDVDEVDGEVDHVYVNGTKLDGQLTGANNQWATDTFTVPTDLLRLPTADNPTGTNDFYIDIDVNNGEWAVQVDWAELRPLDESNDVRPAVFVHGITGNEGENGESSMWEFKEYFLENQPELVGRAIAPPLTKNDSIEANVALLAPEIDALLTAEPAKQVDMVAHSMGGLESRLYAFDNPGRVRSLVMVATPNGGSVLADIACAVVNIPWSFRNPGAVIDAFITSIFGDCNGAEDGLYQLRESYVRGVFNKQVPDLPSVDYATIAGDGGGFLSILLAGADDGAVTVDSVRYLDENHEDHPGQHASLLPAYSLGHGALIEPGSPAYERSLCYLYDSLSQCEESVQTADDAVVAEEPYQPAGGIADSVPPGETRTYDLPAGAGEDAKLLINTESADLEVAVSAATLEPTTAFLVPATMALFTGPQTLTVTNIGTDEQAFLSLLLASSARTMTLDAPALADPGELVPLSVTLTGALPGDAPEYQVTDADDTVVASGALTDAGSGQWTADVSLADEGSHSVSAWVEGDEPRVAGAPVIVAGGGVVENGFTETVGDDDGDALYDWVDLTVPVDVESAGDYRLAGQILNADGAVVSAAGTTATLSAGQGEMTLHFAGREIHDSGAAGPWHLADVTLSDADLTPLDIAAGAGEIDHDDFGAYEHDVIAVTSITDTGVDADGDGLFEQLDISLDLTVESADSYAVNGKLVAQDGSEVGRADLTASLVVGSNAVTLPFDGAAIGATGKDGPYILRDLSVYPLDAPDSGIALVDAHTTAAYQSEQFPGGVADEAPVASFTVDVAELTVTVDASASTDDVGITGYVWSFGDGGSAEGVTASHTYPTAGTYTIELLVTDTSGQSTIASESVELIGDPPPTCDGEVATIVGVGEAVLRGTSGPDVIVGTDAGETIRGKGGDDIICGGGGADWIEGGKGRDELFGQKGADVLLGGNGKDDLHGGAGRDVLIP